MEKKGGGGWDRVGLGGGRGLGGCVRRSYCEDAKNRRGRGQEGGVRVDVNEELKFLRKSKKKSGGGGGGVRMNVNEDVRVDCEN